MRPESDAPNDVSINPEPETLPGTPEIPASRQSSGMKPFTGGYYWFPTPTPNGVTWSVVTCRDLGCRSDDGHDAHLWPRLIVRLAATWSKDARLLNRHLAQFYTGLPRGRVTRPAKTFLILHGRDSPLPGFEELVVESFRLTGRKVKFIFDEHETQIPGHPEKFSSVFGPVH